MSNLRAKTHARSRLAVLDALIERLDQRPLEAISVRELCEAASVSEATFFNHFGSKSAVLVYFVQLWSIEVGWRARETAAILGPLAAIVEVFERAAADLVAHPGVMTEVVVHQARLGERPAITEVTAAERELRYPDLPGVASLPAVGLDGIWPALLADAVACGELPADTDVDLVFVSLAAFFFGTPIAVRRVDPRLVGPIWRAQVGALLAAPPRRRCA
jgi:AcrR family transcriptional regulator